MGGFDFLNHQKEIAKYLSDSDKRGLLLFHGLGSGKTLSSIAAAEAYPGENIQVITPASLRGNYEKELSKALAKKRYDINSYEGFSKNPSTLKNKMLILDEAHRLRDVNGSRSKLITSLAPDAEKVIALSATPIVNYPSDIAPLINAVAGEKVLPDNKTSFDKMFLTRKRRSLAELLTKDKKDMPLVPKNLDKFKEAVRGYVSHYDSSGTEDFPDVNETVEEVPMSKEQYNQYKAFEKESPKINKILKENNMNPKNLKMVNAFLNKTRQISNVDLGKESSPKIDKIVRRIIDSKRPSVVYSNYLDSGVNNIASRLNDLNIPYATFTGSNTDKEKNKMVKDYNDGLLKALLISSAGGEGLDLKNTEDIHVMEPHWNDPKIKQIIGRGARYKSHASLPPEERKVNVIRYLSKRPGGILDFLNRNKPTADKYLYELSKKKNILNEAFLKALQEASI